MNILAQTASHQVRTLLRKTEALKCSRPGTAREVVPPAGIDLLCGSILRVVRREPYPNIAISHIFIDFAAPNPLRLFTMSSQTVSQSTTVLQSLSNTATTLRRLISDNQVKVGSIDSFTSSSFRPKWVSNRDTFFSIVDQSETSASKLAGTINYYLSLLGDVKDADLESEMIEELSALNVKLNGLNFDQSPDITALKSDFHQIAQDLSAVFQERDATVRGEFEAAQTEVATLTQQLDEVNAQIRQADEDDTKKTTSSAKTYIGGVLSGSKKDPKADKNLSAEEQAKLAKSPTQLARMHARVEPCAWGVEPPSCLECAPVTSTTRGHQSGAPG
ncbi:hypothetical protein NUW54_g3357 [Trametes sanguinea]|uniref:Uncharacterized protein n=1 Tax=Trametes sanguinea TaxID=158606 RepID=A0ACC1Q0Y4_9APHY|nr:hypothetical protein NUW54_g3357 [Trametes sanguinea]